MTSTSSERVVLRAEEIADSTPRDWSGTLRGGRWTRLGRAGLVGDPVTEATLDGLAERAREAGHAQGYAAGWAEGRRSGLAGIAATEATRADEHAVAQETALATLASATDSMTAAAERLDGHVAAAQQSLSDQVVTLALQIAESVLGRELETSTEPGADALRRALAVVPAGVPVTVRLNPEDRAAIAAGTLEPIAAGRQLTVVADQAVRRGDAYAETTAGLVDATIAAALSRVREVLSR